MKGANPEQLASHPKFKRTLHNILDDWNSLHKEQARQSGKKLTIMRLTLTISRFLEQPGVYNQLINANINLEEE